MPIPSVCSDALYCCRFNSEPENEQFTFKITGTAPFLFAVMSYTTFVSADILYYVIIESTAFDIVMYSVSIIAYHELYRYAIAIRTKRTGNV